jgi:hypothetical protein
LVALANFMRLSLMKAARVIVSSEAKQEIRVRYAPDDKFSCEIELSSRPERSVVICGFFDPACCRKNPSNGF